MGVGELARRNKLEPVLLSSHVTVSFKGSGDTSGAGTTWLRITALEVPKLLVHRSMGRLRLHGHPPPNSLTRLSSEKDKWLLHPDPLPNSCFSMETGSPVHFPKGQMWLLSQLQNSLHLSAHGASLLHAGLRAMQHLKTHYSQRFQRLQDLRSLWKSLNLQWCSGSSLEIKPQLDRKRALKHNLKQKMGPWSHLAFPWQVPQAELGKEENHLVSLQQAASFPPIRLCGDGYYREECGTKKICIHFGGWVKVTEKSYIVPNHFIHLLNTLYMCKRTQSACAHVCMQNSTFQGWFVVSTVDRLGPQRLNSALSKASREFGFWFIFDYHQWSAMRWGHNGRFLFPLILWPATFENICFLVMVFSTSPVCRGMQ